MHNFLGLLLLMVLVLVGCWLRWQLVVHDPLWVDELHSSWVLAADWSRIVPRAIAGNQSPLYFWLSFPFVQGWGQSPLGLRFLSLLAACGLLALGVWIVWQLTRSWLAAATTALLLAIDSQLVFYASEARPYALVQWVGLLLTWRAFLRVQAVECGRGWELMLLAFALVMLHPTAILLTLTVAAMLFFLRRVPQPLDGAGIAAASALGVALNPATATWLQRRELWQGLADLPGFSALCLGSLLGAWLVPGLIRRGLFKRLHVQRRDSALAVTARPPPAVVPAYFWLGCFLGPTVGAALLSGSGLAGLATPRYLAAVWSFPAVGLGLQLVGLPWRRAIALGALGIFLLALGGVPLPQNHGWHLVRTNPWAVSLWRDRALVGLRSEGWREVHEYLQAAGAGGRQLIWLYPNLIEDELWERSAGRDEQLNEYLTFPLRGIYALPEATIEPRAFRAEHLLEATDLPGLHSGRVWVVLRCAAAEVPALVEVWQQDWARIGGSSRALRIEFHLTAGDVQLLAIEAPSQPGGAEQSQ